MLYGDGSTDGGYYEREIAYQYGLGGELGGLFSFIGKAAKGALSLVPGGSEAVSIATSLAPGGGGTTGAATYRVDGARWSAAKQQWELPPGTRAAVQSPRPTIVGLQDMKGGVTMAPAPTYVPPILQSGTAAGGPNAPLLYLDAKYTPAKHPHLFNPAKPPDARPGWVWVGSASPPRWGFAGGTAPIPATPSQAAGAPAGYGGAPAFPLLPVLLGVGALAVVAMSRASGGQGTRGNWE